MFDCLNLTSKGGKLNVMQDLNKSFPGHWLLPFSSQPFLDDFCVDLFSIVQMFVGHDFDSRPVIQEKVPNSEYLSAISTRILTTVPSVNVNFINSDKVDLVLRCTVWCTKPDQSTIHHPLQFPCYLLLHGISVSPILNIVPVSSHLMHF